MRVLIWGVFLIIDGQFVLSSKCSLISNDHSAKSHECFLLNDGQYAASSEWSVHSPLPSCDSGGFNPSRRICHGAISYSIVRSQIPYIIRVTLSLCFRIHTLGNSSRSSSNLVQSRLKMLQLDCVGLLLIGKNHAWSLDNFTFGQSPP